MIFVYVCFVFSSERGRPARTDGGRQEAGAPGHQLQTCHDHDPGPRPEHEGACHQAGHDDGAPGVWPSRACDQGHGEQLSPHGGQSGLGDRRGQRLWVQPHHQPGHGHQRRGGPQHPGQEPRVLYQDGRIIAPHAHQITLIYFSHVCIFMSVVGMDAIYFTFRCQIQAERPSCLP